MIVLGVIPARGSSKSVPLKNIKELCGKPLIAYSIESARRSKLLSRLVLSTDHEEIANIAKRYGCEVIERPSQLATDTAPTEWGLIHTLETLKKNEGFWPDIVLTLEPTSPFRTTTLIDKCIEILREKDVDSVFAVVASHSCYGKIVDGQFKFLFPGQPRRRQDREPLYKESGTIYATRTTTLVRKKSLLGDKLYPVVISNMEAIDINTEFDFCIAEALMKLKIEGKAGFQ